MFVVTIKIKESICPMSSDCSICLDLLSKETTLELTCAHTFHARCICGWFQTGSTVCPICRQQYIEKPTVVEPLPVWRVSFSLSKIPEFLLITYNAYVFWYTVLWSSHGAASWHILLIQYVTFQAPGDWDIVQRLMNPLIVNDESYYVLLLARLFMFSRRGHSLFNATRLLDNQLLVILALWFCIHLFRS